ncbi:MAG: DUF222 domain-containing protein [Aquihabitans sp.]
MAPLEAALIAVSDPGGLCDEDLSEAVIDLQRLRSRLDAIAASHVARWDARCLWASDNSRAAGARLARDVGTSPAGANATVATARRVRNLAVVAHAWAAGQISTDHVTRLTRAATPERAQAFTRSEAELVAAAQDLDWAGFERAVRFFETAADDERLDPTNPDDVAAHEGRERAKRRCKLRPVGDGWHLDAHLDRVGGAEVHATWERIYQELFESDYARARELQGDHVGADRMDRTPDQRRADALVEMARRAGATRPGDQMPRPSVSVVVSAGELFGPIRDLFNGLVLSRLEVARLLTEADIESILFDDATAQPVTVTSRARFFTGALRRAVEVRDRVCSHPTCHVEAEHCQIDHIIEVTAGGQTTVTNGRLLCPTHNRQRPGRQPHTGAAKDRENGGQRGSDQSSRAQDSDPDGDPHQPHGPQR